MKTMIVTGSNSGIGKQAALKLAKEGYRILMLCRDSEKSKQAQQEIKTLSGNDDVVMIPVDLAESKSIRKAVDEIQAEYPVIDVLVNNAGVFGVKREVNSNGVEINFAVNYLATFMLSQLLLKNLESSEDGRIVNVVSQMYKTGKINFDDLTLENSFNAGKAYANSKLATVLYSVELARRVQDRGITVNSLHPGALATDVFRDYPQYIAKILNLFLEKPEKGGDRIFYLATSEQLKNVTGKYFHKLDKRNIEISPEDVETTQKLWRIAENLTNLAV